MEGRVGVGSWSSLGVFFNELKVDDLPCIPSCDLLGEDLLEASEIFRTSDDLGPLDSIANFAGAIWDGDEGCEPTPFPTFVVAGSGLRGWLLTDGGLREAKDPPLSEDEAFGGRGNSGPGLLRRVRRKKVVVV